MLFFFVSVDNSKYFKRLRNMIAEAIDESLLTRPISELQTNVFHNEPWLECLFRSLSTSLLLIWFGIHWRSFSHCRLVELAIAHQRQRNNTNEKLHAIRFTARSRQTATSKTIACILFATPRKNVELRKIRPTNVANQKCQWQSKMNWLCVCLLLLWNKRKENKMKQNWMWLWVTQKQNKFDWLTISQFSVCSKIVFFFI